MSTGADYLALLELLQAVQNWAGGEHCLGCDKPVGKDWRCRRKRCVTGRAQSAVEAES